VGIADHLIGTQIEGDAAGIDGSGGWWIAGRRIGRLASSQGEGDHEGSRPGAHAGKVTSRASDSEAPTLLDHPRPPPQGSRLITRRGGVYPRPPPQGSRPHNPYGR